MTEQGIGVIDYLGFVKGMAYLPKRIRHFLFRKVFKRISGLSKVDFDVVWSFDNSVFYDFDFLPKRVIKICHIVDLNMDYNFIRAAATADMCFGCSSYIVDKLSKVNQNSFFINHGYVGNSYEEQIEINSDKIKVGYAGNLDIKYLDWDLLNKCFKKYDNVDFYLAGNMDQDHNIGAHENVHHMGVLPKSQLTSFYKNMDLLVIAYRADEFKEQLANPHKMMEYLGSGKPIVATFTTEYSGLGNLIYMSKNNNEWLDVFDDALKDIRNTSELKLADQRKEVAIQNTYDKQIDVVEKLILQCK